MNETDDLAWVLGLGVYNDHAVETLQTQLSLLRGLVDLRDGDISLTYRLGTTRDEDDMRAILQLSCRRASRADASPRKVGPLMDLAASGLIRGYKLGAEPQPLGAGDHVVWMRPQVRDGRDIPITRDWSPLVDQFRRRDDELTLDMTARFIPRAARFSRMPPVAEGDDPGADFFSNLIPSRPSAPAAIGLAVALRSTATIDVMFAKLIGRQLFGVPVELVGLEEDALIVGTPEQIIRVWHAPYGNMEGRGAFGDRHTRLFVQGGDLPAEGTVVGEATIQGRRLDSTVSVRLTDEDRLKHVYIIGKTGAGKSNLLKNLAKQDVASGAGGLIISPHPDLIEHVVQHADDRLDDIVLLDFGDPEFLPSINPLLLDVDDDADFDAASEELLALVMRSVYNEHTGPVFEDTVRMLLRTVQYLSKTNGLRASISLALDVLSSASSREWIAEHLSTGSAELAEHWKSFNSMLGTSVAEQARWTAAKFSAFGSNGMLRLVGAGTRSPLSLRDIYDSQKVLVVHLPESSLGAGGAEFIGALLFSRIYRIAVERRDNGTRPFFVHVDEFQKFVTMEIEHLVAEARKFNIALTFAHQNLRQLSAFSRFEGRANTRLLDAILSNVGTVIAMKVSGHDVAELANEFQVSESDVREIAQYQALIRPVMGGSEKATFTLRVPLAEAAESGVLAYSRVRSRMIDEGVWVRRSRLRDQSIEEAEKLEALKAAAKAKTAHERESKLGSLRRAQADRLEARNANPIKSDMPSDDKSLADGWGERLRAASDKRAADPPVRSEEPLMPADVGGTAVIEHKQGVSK